MAFLTVASVVFKDAASYGSTEILVDEFIERFLQSSDTVCSFPLRLAEMMTENW